MAVPNNFVINSDFAHMPESLSRKRITLSVPANISLGSYEDKYYNSELAVEGGFDNLYFELRCSAYSDFLGSNNAFRKVYQSQSGKGSITVTLWIIGGKLVLRAKASSSVAGSTINLGNPAMTFTADVILLKSPFSA